MGSFSDLAEVERQRRKGEYAVKCQRARVLWLQDQINLAVYHNRPKYEIDDLMSNLAIATSLDLGQLRRRA